MPTIDIDRDAAHEAAQRELSKPIYPRASLTERIGNWLDELLYRIADAGSSVPGGWFTIAVLLVVLAVGVVVAVWVALRTMRTRRDGDRSLFGPHELSAAEHRAAAQTAASVGNWAVAIRHRLRTVARLLEETAVLDPVPGRTATELARYAGSALPELSDEFTRAAEAFNDVTYGGRPGTPALYATVATLDDHLRTHPPATVPTGAAQAGGAWAEVQ